MFSFETSVPIHQISGCSISKDRYIYITSVAHHISHNMYVGLMNAQTEDIEEHLDPTRCRKPCVTGSLCIFEKKIIIIIKIRSMRLAGRLVSDVRNLRNLSSLFKDALVY